MQTEWVSSDWETKLNLSIASQELPDFFRCSTVQFNQLMAGGMLEDISGVFDTYASPGLKGMMEKDPEMFSTAFDGEAMLGVPRLHYGYSCQPAFVWIRNDWYTEQGSPEIKTIAQFEDLMRKFKDNYGDGYALIDEQNLRVLYQMANSFGAYPRDWDSRMWVDDGSGNIISGYEMPQMKDALAAVARWYEEGLLRPDFATATGDDVNMDIVAGNAGMQVSLNWAAWGWQNVVQNFGNEAYLVAHDLPTVDGSPATYPISFINEGYNVATKGCNNPEALIKIINDYVYVLNEATVDGSMTSEQVLPFTTNNMHHIAGPAQVLFRSYDDVNSVMTAVRTGVEEFTTGYARSYYEELMRWPNSQDVTALGRYLQQGFDEASLTKSNVYEDNDQYIFTETWGPQPQFEIDNGKILDGILTEGFTQIIMGVQPVDYYDQLMEDWRTAGGEEMKQAVNQMYGGGN